MLTQSSLGFFALATLLNQAAAHSWVEAINLIGPNGTFIGATGYPRGFVPRNESGFSDSTMVNLIPPDGRTTGLDILPTDLMCKSTQTTPNQTPGYPVLQAAPGANIAFRYQENGHVTLPQTQAGKPANRGTVYIYGTSEPQATDTLLGIYGQWNAAGTGGDGRGKLIATQNYDDDQCYQVNSGTISNERQKNYPIIKATDPEGTNLWCQNNFALPQGLPTGKLYTLYWVWWWPTAVGTPGFKDGKNETYTTCQDIMINGQTTGSGTNEAVEANQYADSETRNSMGVPALLKTLSGPAPMAAAPTASSSSSPVAPATMATTTPPAAAGPATTTANSASLPPANTPGSMVTIVVPVTTLMTTVVQAPISSVPAPATTAPSASSSVSSMVPGSSVPATASSLSSVAPPSPSGTSSCTPSNGGQKRSQIFGTKPPSRQSVTFATN